jgi:hypothetical protein
MTQLIITLASREAPIQVSSGWMCIVDLDEHRVLQKTAGIEAPHRARDLNPRGGMRGMRGLSFYNGELAVAGYSAIFFFDRHWNLLRVFTHPSVSGIHEILYTEGGLWVTSTANDLLVRFDGRGKLAQVYDIRSQRRLMQKIDGPLRQTLSRMNILEGSLDFRKRSYFKSDAYDRTHLNSIAVAPDGQFLLSLGLITGDYFAMLMNIKTMLLHYRTWGLFLALNQRIRNFLRLNKLMLSELAIQPVKAKSAIVCFDMKDESRLLLKFNAAQNPSHSVRLLNDGTGFYLDTSHGELVHFDMQGNILSNIKVTDKFLRGLLVLPYGQLIIGAGNSLLIFDQTTGTVLDEIELSDDLHDTVFDVKILPSDFDLPPISLQAKLGSIVGYKGQAVIWE